MNFLWSFDSRRSSLHSSRSSLSSRNNSSDSFNHVSPVHAVDDEQQQMAHLAMVPPPMPLAGITKLRDRLSLKHARAALAEREILKRENRCKRPLTQRNVDTFLIEQDLNDARLRRTDLLHVSQWLQQLP